MSSKTQLVTYKVLFGASWDHQTCQLHYILRHTMPHNLVLVVVPLVAKLD